MATVQELSEPYANYLLPVLPAQSGVCSICHTSIAGTYLQCWTCNSSIRNLNSRADALSFVALAVKEGQLAQELAYYKSDVSFPSRARTEDGLAAVLWRWLKSHEACVARRAGVDNFPLVTVIPSTRGRVGHPLVSMVGERIGVTRERFKMLIAPNLEFPEDHDRQYSVDRFVLVEAPEPGIPVLIIDDTFTSGSRVQSASALLKEAGYGPIGVVCLGRHFSMSQSGEHRVAANRYFEKSRALGWGWDYCCLCDQRVA